MMMMVMVMVMVMELLCFCLLLCIVVAEAMAACCDLDMAFSAFLALFCKPISLWIVAEAMAACCDPNMAFSAAVALLSSSILLRIVASEAMAACCSQRDLHMGFFLCLFRPPVLKLWRIAGAMGASGSVPVSLRSVENLVQIAPKSPTYAYIRTYHICPHTHTYIATTCIRRERQGEREATPSPAQTQHARQNHPTQDQEILQGRP
jgi:hypothetical protein